jgi:hypothetical protein
MFQIEKLASTKFYQVKIHPPTKIWPQQNLASIKFGKFQIPPTNEHHPQDLASTKFYQVNLAAYLVASHQYIHVFW